jgi:hypothetical protein
LSWPLTTTAPQKNEKKTFATTSFTGILTQSTVCSTYPNYRPFYIFWHTMHWKKSYILHCNHRQFVADVINRGVKANFSILQLFDRVWTMVYNNVTYFANDGLPNDTTGTLIVLLRPRAVPRNPRVATHWCPTTYDHTPQKWTSLQLFDRVWTTVYINMM